MTADEMAKLLDEIGQRLGPTGQYVFGLAVRQVYIDAVVAIVFLAVTLIVAVVAIPRLYRWQAAAKNPYSSRDIVAGLLGSGPIFLVGLAFIDVLVQVPAIANPEYAAIRGILRAIAR